MRLEDIPVRRIGSTILGLGVVGCFFVGLSFCVNLLSCNNFHLIVFGESHWLIDGLFSALIVWGVCGLWGILVWCWEVTDPKKAEVKS